MKKHWMYDTKFRYLINALAVAALAFVILYLIEARIINRFYSRMLIPIGINIILAVSLNLSAGFLGQLPLGHAGFMSVGAYTAALYTMSAGQPDALGLGIGLLLAALVASAFGVLIGLPALRLRGDYLAIITLGFGEIIRVIILNLDFTGGAYGLKGIPKLTTVPWVIGTVVVVIFLTHALIKSRHGRAILSIREDEIAAEASGIATTFYKVATFAISAAFAGVAGGLYAHYLSILDAGSFGFMKSVEILVMVVLGGLGSMIGSVVSAVVLTVLPEVLRNFAEYRMVIYSLLLIIVMIFKPSGLFGRYDFSLLPAIDGTIQKLRGLGVRGKGASSDDADPEHQ